MEQLPAVAVALPDATLVITHRDPVASIQSAITGFGYAARMSRKRVDLKAIADYWVDRYERLLRAGVRDRDNIGDDRCHDVYFHELMCDPQNVLGAIYAKAGLILDERTRSAFAAAIAENKRGKHGQIDHDLRGDFGLDPRIVRDRFSFYFDRFPCESRFSKAGRRFVRRQ